MATLRPTVSVFGADGKSAGSVAMPAVFGAPLRADVVRTVHSNMNKNKRQAMGVKDEAGYDTAAASWGTGRAVARIPRVPGGGTHRSGQGAFGNMCRGGGMFNPTKTWRRWHRKVNVTQKRHAMAFSLAATGVPALVMARGHRVEEVPELPLVIKDGAEKLAKTKEAVALLTSLGCKADLDKVKETKKVRCGKGKMRNRRYVSRKGPLVVFDSEEGTKAFRNIPGVDVCNVERLNLLQLAPGGTFGRLVVYTEAAMAKLATLYGSYTPGSSSKKNYTLPRAMLQNADIARIINSAEVQAVVTPAKSAPQLKASRQRKNPLKNQSVLGRMAPWSATVKRMNKRNAKKGVKTGKKKTKEQLKKLAANKKAFFTGLEAAYNVAPAAAAEEAAEE